MAHILLVDDDPLIVRDVEERLKSMGHTCDTAGTQQTAEELLATKTYDLYLIDLELPLYEGGLLSNEFGRNLLDKIVTTPVQRDKPVIVITGYEIGSYHLGVEMMKRGAFDVVGKPFGSKHPLEEKIREALRKFGPARSEHRARGVKVENHIQTPFTEGTLVFYSDRVELRGEKIAGAEGKSQMRQVLDLMKTRYLSGDRRTLGGSFIGRELKFPRGPFTVSEAVRQIRDTCSRVMAKKCHLVCGTNDVITNRQLGYVFSPGIRVQDGEADEPGQPVNTDELNAIQSEILRELRANPLVPRAVLNSHLQVKATSLNLELARLTEKGLIVKEGSGAATQYKLAHR
jgi:DNA-binding response OmpR family regulator